MRGLILVTTMMALIVSCASTRSSNKVSHSDIRFPDGVYKDKSWDEDLVFYRTSWFKGATLSYDLLLVKLDKNSSFSNWLEKSKETYDKDCKQLLIGMFYSGRTEPASLAEIKAQVLKLGYKEVSVASFKDHVSSHYVYEQWHLTTHKLVGFCYQGIGTPSDIINISIPGFNQVNVRPE
jgi:hypothetical protein